MLKRNLGGAVGGAIIHHNNYDLIHASQLTGQLLQYGRQMLRFVVGRDLDRQFHNR